jgi:Tol biopolymer transport system component
MHMRRWPGGSARRVAATAAMLAGVLAVSAGSASAVPIAATFRVSVSSSSGQANAASGHAILSANGHTVAFNSTATNLSVAADTNRRLDVFVHDSSTGATRRASVSTSGAQANGTSSANALSADGRYVLFTSSARNLVRRDTNGMTDAFVRDLVARTTSRVSLGNDGHQPDGSSRGVALSPSGRFALFVSRSHNLTTSCPTHHRLADELYLRDRRLHTTRLVSIGPGGVNLCSFEFTNAFVMQGGHTVLFGLLAPKSGEEFVDERNMDTRTTTELAGPANFCREDHPSAASADGRFLLVTEGSDCGAGVYRGDLQANTWTLVSQTAGGAAVQSAGGIGVSDDGRYAAFASADPGVVPGDTNGKNDVFVRDVMAATTTRVDLTSTAAQLTHQVVQAALSGDGAVVAFETKDPTVVPGDTNGVFDVFTRGPLH